MKHMEEINNCLDIIEKEFISLNSLLIENTIESRGDFYKKSLISSSLINDNIYNITNIVKNIREEKLEETKDLSIKFLNENKNNEKLKKIKSSIDERNILEVYNENKEDLFDELSLNLELFFEIIKVSKENNNYQIKIEEIKKYRVFIHDVINKLNLISINLINKILSKELEKKEILKDESFFKNMLIESLDTITLLKKDFILFKERLIMSDEEYKKNLKELEENFYILLPSLFQQKITFQDAKTQTILTLSNDEKYKKYLKYKFNIDKEEEVIKFLNENFL